MDTTAVNEAASLIWQYWQTKQQLPLLPTRCRPVTRADGFAVQAAVAARSGQTTRGWKIAASSVAGQKHIGVDGPLAGRLLADRVISAGSAAANAIDLSRNILRVAEPEFTFRMARDLPPRASNSAPYSQAEVIDAVDSLHLSIEFPDTRLSDYVHAGAPSLIADFACAAWWVVGPAIDAPWRDIDLSKHTVTAYKNGSVAAVGSGANVLDDPRIALTWIANELATFDAGLKTGDFVTTGTSVVPVPIAPGDSLSMDFGVLGTITAACK